MIPTDEIISMAHECHVPVDWRVKNLVRFANLVAARERESCAKVCDDAKSNIGEAVIIGMIEHQTAHNVCENIALKIRARGDQHERT